MFCRSTEPTVTPSITHLPPLLYFHRDLELICIFTWFVVSLTLAAARAFPACFSHEAGWQASEICIAMPRLSCFFRPLLLQIQEQNESDSQMKFHAFTRVSLSPQPTQMPLAGHAIEMARRYASRVTPLITSHIIDTATLPLITFSLSDYAIRHTTPPAFAISRLRWASFLNRAPYYFR